MNSPAVKAFCDERIADGETLVVVDLGGCTGMDSTFMGTLAGIAARLSAKDGGVLQIAFLNNRSFTTRSSELFGTFKVSSFDILLSVVPCTTCIRG